MTDKQPHEDKPEESKPVSSGVRIDTDDLHLIAPPEVPGPVDIDP